jgi:GntR family transcriptional repressor for pyruvate dehydrogenase complex
MNPGAGRLGGDGSMRDSFAPVLKQSLSDKLAQRIRAMIQKGEYQQGDRLPPIMEMAKRFGVGHPTIREALKKLETMGFVEIRHGSGVYVSRSEEVLVLASPDYGGTVTKKLLLDLINARMPLEVMSVAEAVKHGTPEDLVEMRRLLTTAGQNLANDVVLNEVNMGFHRQIALASGNTVLLQLLDVLHELFTDEQRLILGIFGSRERDHKEHLAILDALDRRDAKKGTELMRKHLQGVADSILRWNPDDHPVT